MHNETVTPIYFYSYCWQGSRGTVYENEVTTRHPLLIVHEWVTELDGNNGAILLSYHRIRDDEIDPELADYLKVSLEDNMGELW
jgi:hypothetical protein